MPGDATPAPPEFRIGLCMAGAISGGAYAAGVVDFLLEALEEWENEKKKEEKKQKEDPKYQSCVPTHRVKIAAMSGASAGGMITAILCRALATGIKPVRDPLRYTEMPAPDPERQTLPYDNPLFVAWVENIDIKHLLATRDLADDKASVNSGLDSSVLDQICRNVLYWPLPKRAEPPPYVADPLDVYFTTTNLRGVAYGIPLTGAVQGYRHMMTVHADYSRFSLTWQPPAAASNPMSDEERDRRNAIRLEPAQLADSGNWQELTTAALASGAFPVGLKPRRLKRKAAVYDERLWKVPAANPLCAGTPPKAVPEKIEVQQQIVCTEGQVIRAVTATNRPLPAIWPSAIAAAKDSFDYWYWNVDGGVMNNEPMEFVRRALAGSSGRNERSGSTATSAILMIDPFPNESPLTADYPDKLGLMGAVGGLFSSLVAQARFKPEDLVLALDESVFSRFIIFPTYSERGANIREPAMCAATLGGFGGFLSEAFRRHDFALGRRNCQQFLRRHFALLDDNKLFDQFPDTCRENAWILDDDSKKPAEYVESGSRKKFLPIIPLYGSAAETIPLPQRPSSRDVDRDALRKAITARLEAVVPRLIADLPNGLLRLVLRIVWTGAWLIGQRGRIVDAIMEKIEQAIKPLDS